MMGVSVWGRGLLAVGANALFAVIAPVLAFADVPSALVTAVSGAVSHRSTEGVQVVPPYSKLRSNTKIVVSDGAVLQLAYLANGRQETWKGPQQLVIGHESTNSETGGEPSSTRQLPEVIVRGLRGTSDAIATIRSVHGMVRVRSLSPAADNADAMAEYSALRKSTTHDDLTPELYLLGTLVSRNDAKGVAFALDEMLGRQPQNKDIQELARLFRSKEAPNKGQPGN